MHDFRLDIDAVGTPALELDHAADTTITNNIYLSLMVPQGSWFHNPEFGSRLHLLRREKNTERTAYLAREYCREALQWLLDSGRATAIDITVQSDRSLDPYRLLILVEATQADGMQISFTLFQEVA
jgi:phage gp46-like protein